MDSQITKIESQRTPGLQLWSGQVCSAEAPRPQASATYSRPPITSPPAIASGLDVPIPSASERMSLPKLGEGAGGSVHNYNYGGVDYALKILSEGGFLKKELAAIELMRNLRIPNMPEIVTVSNEKRIVIFRKAPGISLETILKRDYRGKPMPARLATEIVLRVGQALEGLAGEGLIHRDVKPANVMVHMVDGAVAEVNLVDIGILAAQHATEADGTIIGTPEYMSPEQAMNLPTTPKSDVYSLGKLYYRLLTGRSLHQADSMCALITKVLSDNPTSLTDPRLGSVPEAPRRLVLEMLTPAVDNRPVARHVVTELECLLDIDSGIKIQRANWEAMEPLLSERSPSLTEKPTIDSGQRLGEQPTMESRPMPSRWLRGVQGASNLGISLGGGIATVAVMSGLGVENKGALTVGAIAGGHGTFVGVSRLLTGRFMPIRAQGQMLGIGLPAGFLANSMYNSFLDGHGVAQDSFARSFMPQAGATIGGGYLIASAGLAAVPFGAFAIANELPGMVYDDKTYSSKLSSIEMARHEMARAYEEDDDYAALFFLGLSKVPIFDKLPAFFID